MGDIDVLATEEEARRLHSALLAQGYRESGHVEPRHHLPRLVDPSGRVLEIHHRLRGVFISSREATAEDCLEADGCTALEVSSRVCFVPNGELMLAHLLAHTLDQHAMTPEAYRPFLVVADLQDLGALCETEGPDWGAAAERVRGSVSRSEIAALRELSSDLSAGRPASAIASETSDSASLLHHFLAGQSSDEYRRALRLRREMQVPPGKNPARAGLEAASRALWVSDEQIDLIYGRPTGRLGYLGWRLWRPFDLLARLASSFWAALRLRRRGRVPRATRKGV